LVQNKSGISSNDLSIFGINLRSGLTREKRSRKTKKFGVFINAFKLLVSKDIGRINGKNLTKEIFLNVFENMKVSSFGFTGTGTRNKKDIFILEIDDLNLIFVKKPFGKRRMNHISTSGRKNLFFGINVINTMRNFIFGEKVRGNGFRRMILDKHTK
jgi:hypothetical protein